jgi:hypothetical protein
MTKKRSTLSQQSTGTSLANGNVLTPTPIRSNSLGKSNGSVGNNNTNGAKNFQEPILRISVSAKKKFSDKSKFFWKHFRFGKKKFSDKSNFFGNISVSN